MKNVASAILLLVFVCLLSVRATAQTVSLSDASNACTSITQKTGDVNSTLGGVRPTSVDPNTHPNMVTHVSEIGGYVATVEAGISASTVPSIAAYSGQLNAKYMTFVGSASYLCYCITTGDLVNANGIKNVVRDDFMSLRALAEDIRGEIQKGIKAVK